MISPSLLASASRRYPFIGAHFGARVAFHMVADRNTGLIPDDIIPLFALHLSSAKNGSAALKPTWIVYRRFMRDPHTDKLRVKMNRLVRQGFVLEHRKAVRVRYSLSVAGVNLLADAEKVFRTLFA